jgi:hypothetical protein
LSLRESQITNLNGGLRLKQLDFISRVIIGGLILFHTLTGLQFPNALGHFSLIYGLKGRILSSILSRIRSTSLVLVWFNNSHLKYWLNLR